MSTYQLLDLMIPLWMIALNIAIISIAVGKIADRPCHCHAGGKAGEDSDTKEEAADEAH